MSQATRTRFGSRELTVGSKNDPPPPGPMKDPADANNRLEPRRNGRMSSRQMQEDKLAARFLCGFCAARAVRIMFFNRDAAENPPSLSRSANASYYATIVRHRLATGFTERARAVPCQLDQQPTLLSHTATGSY